MCLERGALSLVGTTKELLDRKVAAPVYKTENTAVEIRHADHMAPLSPQKLAITSPTSGGRSVGTVRSRTQATGFSFSFISSRQVLLLNFVNILQMSRASYLSHHKEQRV
jgi:hypothetical protein